MMQVKSCNSVRMRCSIKRLLILSLSYLDENSRKLQLTALERGCIWAFSAGKAALTSLQESYGLGNDFSASYNTQCEPECQKTHHASELNCLT